MIIPIRFIQIFRMLFPYWASGIAIGAFLSIFMTKQIAESILKYDKKSIGWFRYTLAAGIGIASPICMYGTLPILMNLKKKGVDEPLLVAFMVGSVLLNPNLIILTMALGPGVAVWRIGTALVAGSFAGLLAHLYQSRRQTPIYKIVEFEYHSKSATIKNPAKRYLYGLHKTTVKTVPYFFAGILLTVLIETYIPLSVLTTVLGVESGYSVLMATMLGVPLYACGGGSIPILQAMIASGLPLGSGIAFMLSGPMTKINNIGAVKMVLGMKHFVMYIVYAVIFSLMAGLLINLII